MRTSGTTPAFRSPTSIRPGPARASRPARLWFQLQEYDDSLDGPNYQATCELPGDGVWATRVMPLKEFRYASGRPDANKQPDPHRVWLLALGNATRADPPVEAELVIDNVSAGFSA